jgi:hypothetical protein
MGLIELTDAEIEAVAGGIIFDPPPIIVIAPEARFPPPLEGSIQGQPPPPGLGSGSTATALGASASNSAGVAQGNVVRAINSIRIHH